MSGNLSTVLDLALLSCTLIYFLKLLIDCAPLICADKHRRPLRAVYLTPKRSLSSQRVMRRAEAF